MPSISEKFLQGEVMRVTLLDDCGAPAGGSCAFATSEGWAQATLTPNVTEGDEFKQKNAAGRFLINQRSRPLLNWFDYSLQFFEVDPELFTLLTGNPVILDDSGPDPVAVGFGVDEETFATAKFALELWLNLAEGADCADQPCYGYSLLPFAIDGMMAESITVANAMINFTINGRTRKGSQWGVGPFDVLLDSTEQPSPLLAPIPATRHYHQQIVCFPPPLPESGCQELLLGS